MNLAMMERADEYGIIGELGMLSYFPELVKGYRNAHRGKSGGYLNIARNWQYSNEELISGRNLADHGYKIYLLPNGPASKCPDMIINDKVGEMKHLSSIRRGTIRHHIRYAGREQMAQILYLYIQNNKQKTRVLEIMKEEMPGAPLEMLILNQRGIIKEYPKSYFQE